MVKKTTALIFLIWTGLCGIPPDSQTGLGNDSATPENQAMIQRQDLISELQFTGELVAEESVTIHAPRTRIWALTISYLVPDGSPVKEGDILVRFDTSRLEMDRLDSEKSLEEARVRIAQKEAELEIRRQDLLLQLAQAEKNLKVAELYAGIDPGLIPRQDYEKYRFDLEKSRLDVKKGEERLSNLEKTIAAEMGIVRLDYEKEELDLQKIQREINVMTIRAPQAGHVLRAMSWETGRKFQVGDSVHEGQLVLSIPYLDTLQVRALIHDADALQLRAGMSAEIYLDSAPQRSFSARIRSLADVAKALHRRARIKQFKLTSDLLEKDLSLMKPGMTARLRVPILRKNVLTIERTAIRLDNRGEAYLARAGTPAENVPVTVTAANDHLVAIEGEIKEGDRFLFPAGNNPGRIGTENEWLDVKLQDLTFSVGGSGVVEARQAVDIGPPALPRVWQYKIMRLAEEGTQVEPGDFLVQFDPTEIADRLRKETADEQKVRQELEKVRSSKELQLKDFELELEEAKAALERSKNKLISVRGFESSLNIQEAEYDAEMAEKRLTFLNRKLDLVRENSKRELDLLENKLRFHQQRVAAHQAALEALTVTAPIPGEVIYKANWNNEKRQVGSTVHMMETFISLPDLTTLMIRGQVAEVDAGKIKHRQKVTISFDGIPERTYNGQITHIADIFHQTSYDRPVKVLEISVEIDELDTKRMRPGMAVRLQVEIDAFQDVLAVPLSAIQVNQATSFVWVMENGTPQKRKVTVGRNNGIVAIIDSGLEEGDRISSRPL